LNQLLPYLKKKSEKKDFAENMWVSFSYLLKLLQTHLFSRDRNKDEKNYVIETLEKDFAENMWVSFSYLSEFLQTNLFSRDRNKDEKNYVIERNT
jgi:hypothetical protein